MEIGFLPLAAPTARIAVGFPICRASCRRIASGRTEWSVTRSTPPLKCRAGKIQFSANVRRWPAKYSSSWCAASTSTGCPAVLSVDGQPHPTGPIVLPQDGGKTIVASHQFQSTDRRAHPFVERYRLRAFCPLVVINTLPCLRLYDSGIAWSLLARRFRTATFKSSMGCPKMASTGGPGLAMLERHDDQDHRRLYKALAARDPRFDGVFFVGVTSTGIYCRPICPAKRRRRPTAASSTARRKPSRRASAPACAAGPSWPPAARPIDDAQRIAQLIVQRLEDGRRRQGRARGDRRAVRAELATDPPDRPEGARRAADPAAADAPPAAGETAADRDDAADHRSRFRQRLRQPAPVQRRLHQALRHGATRLRKKATEGAGATATSTTSTLQLSYRPPYDWKGVLAFLASPRARGRRVGDRRSVCPDRRAGRRQGLDQGDAVAERRTR